MDKWISVNDRLPSFVSGSPSKCVLVTDGNWIAMAYYSETLRWTFADATNAEYIINWTEITHWMPLPEPPKEAHND